jgi:hypothetical protein
VPENRPRTRDLESGVGSLLEDAPRERLRAYTREVHRELPKLPPLSREADASWRERVEASLLQSLHIVDFRGQYDRIYDECAEFDHPSTPGLQVFVHLGGSPVRVTLDGCPERNLDEDLRLYRIAVLAFAEALVVSNLASSHPRLAPLQQALQTIGTLRKLERDGRLVVGEMADGATIDVASEDERSETL